MAESNGSAQVGDDRVPVSQQALASVMCSALLCCPVTSLIGVFLGLRAMRAVRLSAGTLGGAGLARGGVVMGSLALIVHFVLIGSLAKVAADNAATAASSGIRLTFTDPPAALADAWAPGAVRRMTSQQLQDAVDEMIARHGDFERVAVTTPFDQSDAGAGRLSTAVTLFFEDKTLFGRVDVVLTPVTTWPFLRAQLIELTLVDEEAGDILFPPG